MAEFFDDLPLFERTMRITENRQLFAPRHKLPAPHDLHSRSGISDEAIALHDRLMSIGGGETSGIEVCLGTSVCDATDEYIVHGVGCSSYEAVGVNKEIFDRFPTTNTSPSSREPGEISCHVCQRTDGTTVTVVNLYVQRGSGPLLDGETYEHRIGWVRQSLERLGSHIAAQRPTTTPTVAFPFLLGVDQVGASWKQLYSILLDWASDRDVSIRLYDPTSESVSCFPDLRSVGGFHDINQRAKTDEIQDPATDTPVFFKRSVDVHG